MRRLNRLVWYFAICALSFPLGYSAIAIRNLAPNKRIVDSSPILVNLIATHSITSVVALVQERQIPLTFVRQETDSSRTFQGQLDVANLPRGSYELKVTATDAFGNAASGSTNFFLDRLPELRFGAPLNRDFPVLTNSLQHLDITAADDNGCFVAIKAEDTWLPFTNNVLDLSALDHTNIVLWIYAIETTNSSALSTVVGKPVIIERNPNLILEAEAPAPILDFNNTKILFKRPQGSIELIHRSTGATSILADSYGLSGKLTSSGAVYVQNWGSTPLFEFPSGESWAIDFRAANDGSPTQIPIFDAAGSYFAWSGEQGVQRRNVQKGAIDSISTNDAIFLSVTPGGHVLYTSFSGAYLDQRQVFGFGATDGTNVVGLRVERDPQPHPRYYDAVVMLDTPTALVELTAPMRFVLYPTDRLTYAIAAGWVAYSQIDAGGATQVWKRDPSGNKVQLSFFSSDSSVEAINDSGDVIWSNAGRKFLNSHPLGTYLGSTIFRDGKWHVILGSTLFKLDTSRAVVDISGSSLNVSGQGRLFGSSNLIDWVDLGILNGAVTVQPTNNAAFYYIVPSE